MFASVRAQHQQDVENHKFHQFVLSLKDPKGFNAHHVTRAQAIEAYQTVCGKVANPSELRSRLEVEGTYIVSGDFWEAALSP